MDTLSTIPVDKLSEFLASLARPNLCIAAVYHSPRHEQPRLDTSFYATPDSLLRYLATSVIDVKPLKSRDEDAKELDELMVPMGVHGPQFRVVLTSRRRSGRGISAAFNVDTDKHTIDYVPPQSSNDGSADTEVCIRVVIDLLL